MLILQNSSAFFRLLGSLSLGLLSACVQTPIAIQKSTIAVPQPQPQPVSEPQQIRQGFVLLHDPRTGNCTACHSAPDAQGRKLGQQSTFAPALDGVASRYTAVQLRQWLVDARQIHADTRMPPFGVDLGYGRLLSDAQIEALLAALATLK